EPTGFGAAGPVRGDVLEEALPRRQDRRDGPDRRAWRQRRPSHSAGPGRPGREQGPTSRYGLHPAHAAVTSVPGGGGGRSPPDGWGGAKSDRVPKTPRAALDPGPAVSLPFPQEF